MVLGALIIPKDKRQEITENILQIKARYGVKARTEVKWTKASMPKIDLYKDLLNCFFLDDDMRFRVLVAKKTRLNHEAWSQSHNDWYYKMYFTMLNRLFDSTNTYNVYVDIKDTHSAQRTEKLEEVLANSHYDFNHECIKKVQPIRSDEVQMMQITDVINGAVCRANRTTIPQPSGAKAEIIDWTPELVTKSPIEDFAVYEDRIYAIFRHDFIDSHPSFDGLRVSVRRQKEETDGKWAGFFHITSVEDYTTGERNVDLRRCERIRFPRKTIDNAKDESERYLVVLEPHKDRGYCMLVTAYYVDHDHSFNKLLKEYDQSSLNGNCVQ